MGGSQQRRVLGGLRAMSSVLSLLHLLPVREQTLGLACEFPTWGQRNYRCMCKIKFKTGILPHIYLFTPLRISGDGDNKVTFLLSVCE